MTDPQDSAVPSPADGAPTNGNGSAARPSHYERIGGAESVKAAVRLFYDRVLADPELVGYFTSVNMEEQRRHMVLMLTVVLGGPNNYAGRDLAEAHQPLNIPEEHYARVGAHLVDTLTGLGVPDDILDDVRATLGSVRDQVVSSGTSAGV
ncbi:MULTISPECIES: group 1 truncated hemoglobin [unclassified Plantactinospora]|uniref:group I truncated hemoglobin n=1 Tax=unclassified Plantactinospora TaxID=2631981 RepID=UPI000D17400D|nr:MULTISPECIES: group 1 truncated hemoglobin [unclassified Plantactinospora]AVT28767.1 group 1 truncated hemoglobin [Plantactinospora sp. BC1]